MCAPVVGALFGEALGSGMSNTFSPEIEKYGQKAWDATKDFAHKFNDASNQVIEACKQVRSPMFCENPGYYRRIK